MWDVVGCKELRFGRRVVQLVTYNWIHRVLRISLALSNLVVVWCTRSAHPRVENKLRNAIAETTESVERCGRIQREKETTVEMPVPMEGRASVNAQRLLEPLQMCRKRFWSGRKVSADGIWWHVTNDVRCVSHANARRLHGRNEKTRTYCCLSLFEWYTTL